MAGNKVTRVTASGTELTEEEFQSIRRDAIKDTVKNGLAAIGIFTLVVFVKSVLETRNNPEPSDTE